MQLFLLRTTLNSTRVRIHINLFVSFMINNIMWLMWYEIVVDEVKILGDNSVGEGDKVGANAGFELATASYL